MFSICFKSESAAINLEKNEIYICNNKFSYDFFMKICVQNADNYADSNIFYNMDPIPELVS